MDRTELEGYLAQRYVVDADFPWATHPNYAVYRHSGNKKWFALIMEVPREKLGAPGAGPLNIVNVKCDPLMIGSFRAEPGIYPAYHMSKASWLSVALDGSVSPERVKLLLDMSYDLTAPKVKKSNFRRKE